MAEITKIQWTDHTFNPWRGCTKVSEGCRHCYAEVGSKRNPNVLGIWGPQGTRVLAAESYWRQPLRWNKLAQKEGRQHRVFCCSLADVFEDWKGQMTRGDVRVFYHAGEARETPVEIAGNEGGSPWLPYTLATARRRLWQLIEKAPWLDWQLLTKRPENMVGMMPESWRWGCPGNVWAMTSVENQQTADTRIPELLKVLAVVRGLSVEPLLGPVHLPIADMADGRIHWVIIGGESGHLARPCAIEWVRDLIGQCQEAGVPVFVKQLGGEPNCEGNPIVLSDYKGGDPEEWPENLRVREFPA